MDDVFKDLEEQIERKRKQESEREKEHLEAQIAKHDDSSRKSFPLERSVFILIIAALLIYIVYDASFVHPELSSKNQTQKISSTPPTTVLDDASIVTTTSVTATTLQTAPPTTTAASTTEPAPTTTTAAAASASSLSGKVTVVIDEVVTQKKSDTFGSIDEVSFTISNGLTDEIIPVVDVFAFDKALEEEWAGKSRGTFNEDGAVTIKSGEKFTGSIGLTPKSFSNLNDKKTVIIRVKYADDKTPVNALKEITIE